MKWMAAVSVAVTLFLGGTASAMPMAAGDDGIRERVVERIQDDPSLSRAFIRVTVSDAVVNLRGRVGGGIDRSRAAEVARDVEGAREVRNYLQYDR